MAKTEYYDFYLNLRYACSVVALFIYLPNQKCVYI